ncbi:MAG: virulence protein RhuM/Fic/DOC family protein [Candidatus Moranbacteria bacterium]|nr:virulence protein RhuM/Fic/DOC family protein [Candidatus Moranbacteria bacterium]
MKNNLKKLAIYQTKDGEIRLKEDAQNETIWANQKQIAQIFEVDRTVITKHIKNIFDDGEIDEQMVCANFAQTTQHGAVKGKTQTREIKFYNLDIILAVGYRTNSSVAITFRQWAIKILKAHITKGFTINEHQLAKNYQEFLQTAENVKVLTKSNSKIKTEDALELVKTFSETWFSLDQYDKQKFPQKGMSEKKVKVQAKDLYADIEIFKKELVSKKEATELFAQEKKKGNLDGILGNVLQSIFGKDVYLTVEEKAAHLMYFVIKNHPFTDGNKRTGAFSFIWFLQKANFDFRKNISPETLTILTLLIAESNPKEIDKMIGLILLLLSN